MRRDELEEWIRQAEQTGFLEEDCAEPSFDGRTSAVQPGDSIGGFQVVELIGSGGRSDLYRAIQPSVADREVALKVYRDPEADLVENSAAGEVKTLAALEHPNLARIIDAGFTPAHHRYVVMPLLSGVPIAEYCDSKGLSNRQIVGLIRKVCCAVDVLHRRGILHCDLKSSNILVDDVGEPTVTDFDASLHDESADPIRRGTAGNCAPEQLVASRHLPFHSDAAPEVEERPLDATVDVYGIGAVLYRCLAGQGPFAESSVSGALIGTLFDSPKSPSSIRPTVDSNLDRICLRCLQKSPEDRYPTVADLVTQLDDYLASNSAVGRQTWLHSGRRVLAVIAVLLLGIFLLRVVGPTSRQNAVKEAPRAAIDAMPGLLPTTLQGWQLETRDPRPGFVYSQLSPEGDRVAVMGSDSWLRVYSVGEASIRLETMLSMERPTYTEQRAISWHPDGDRLVAAAGSNYAIVWSTKRAERLAKLIPGGEFDLVRDAQWSPDGQQIAIACLSGRVQLYNAAGSLTGEFNGHHGEALRIRWSPSGRRICSGGITGAIYIWDSRSLSLEQVFDHQPQDIASKQSIWALEWHPDGGQVAVGTEGGDVTILDCNSRESTSIGNLKSTIRSLDWPRVGRLFAGCDQLAVYAADSGWSVVDEPTGDGSYASVEWDSQRSRLFATGHHRQLRLWDVENKAYIQLGESNVSRVLALEWSTNGSYLASAGSDGCVRLFDQLGNLQAVTERSPSRSGVHCLSWHPTRLLLACGNGEDGRGIDIYEVGTGGPTARRGSSIYENQRGPESDDVTGDSTIQLLRSIATKEAVESVEWSDQGDYLIAGDFRGNLRVFRVGEWREVFTIKGHDAPPESLDLSVHRLVASADTSGQLLTWRLSKSGKLTRLEERQFDGGVGDIAFDAAGERLVVADRRREVSLLDSRTLADLWERPLVAPARPGKLEWSLDDRQIACGNFGVFNAFEGRFLAAEACNRGGRVAWHPSGLIATGSWPGEVEFRDSPAYRLRSRSLQLAGGITVTVPADGSFPQYLKQPPSHLLWVHQPSPGQYVVESEYGGR